MIIYGENENYAISKLLKYGNHYFDAKSFSLFVIFFYF